MRKMTLLYKISYSALFIALGVILSRFFSLPFMFGLPFLKVSFANSIVMFSSFYLGPIFGFLVGTFVDVLGALLFPTGPFNPLYTIAASLTGLMPYICYKCVKKTKIENKFPFILVTLLIALNIFVITFMCTNDVILSESGKKSYELYPWLKWTLCSVFLVLSITFTTLIIFLKKKFANKKFNKYYDIFVIASSVYLTYFVFKIPVGSLVQSLLLDWDFLIIMTCRMMTGFLTTFIHSVIIILALDLSLRYPVEGALLKKNLPLKERINKLKLSKSEEE